MIQIDVRPKEVGRLAVALIHVLIVPYDGVLCGVATDDGCCIGARALAVWRETATGDVPFIECDVKEGARLRKGFQIRPLPKT